MREWNKHDVEVHLQFQLLPMASHHSHGRSVDRSYYLGVDTYGLDRCVLYECSSGALVNALCSHIHDPRYVPEWMHPLFLVQLRHIEYFHLLRV